MNLIARMTTLFLMLLVTSCGWHLRGHNSQLTAIESVHISAANRQSQLVEILKRQLIANDITVEENASDARYGIVILDQRGSRRVATINTSARVSEYRLVEEVDVVILDSSGKNVLPSTTLSSEKVYEFDEDNVHAKDDEANLLKTEMHHALVRQILARLRLISTKAAGGNDATES